MATTTEWTPATVRAHRDLTPTVREFTLRPEGGVRPWTVGSHIDIRVPIGDGEDTRSYSLVGSPHAPEARDAYRIAVKRMEPGRGGSRWMWSLETGAELAIGHPRNHFPLSFGERRTLLVAGGIGITPIVGMAEALADRGADVRMLYTARSADELAYADALRARLGERLRTFASDAGERLDLDAEFASLPDDAHAWICGPVPLLDGARAAWSKAGRPPAALHIETFGNTGRFDAEPFSVEVPRHGVRVIVPADRTLLDVLLAAGVDVLYDCRRGECGLCAMDVVRRDGTIDHRDVFFSAHEKAESRKLCTCVSRVVAREGAGGIVLDSSFRPD